ncbi:hypothetical protein [Actinotalea sp.]|uniref:hypothetical protein n=1 Tax=Actinotalea sp. TaxID=1872145 RepID=UPI002C6E4934|nr:hypothetical protein [Actinotalea sp.]HQY32931.1 hypothetical protein [Actinotalea sp.]HRA51448.1 hypothetical protein [Actinotalea sp.]
MTAVPIATTTRLRLPVLALGRYRGAVVLEVSRHAARTRHGARVPRALDRLEQQRDTMLALRRGAGV